MNFSCIAVVQVHKKYTNVRLAIQEFFGSNFTNELQTVLQNITYDRSIQVFSEDSNSNNLKQLIGDLKTTTLILAFGNKLSAKISELDLPNAIIIPFEKLGYDRNQTVCKIVARALG